MLTLVRQKDFSNGSVFGMRLEDGFPIEVTDTYLPLDTKFCVNGSNKLISANAGSRAERWMVGVSCMSGCPVGCKFCATGQLKEWRNLTAEEMAAQVVWTLQRNPSFDPRKSNEFKVNWTRMGEPFLNLDAVKAAMGQISGRCPETHHYISTIGLKGSDFSWIEGNTTLQISLHSLDPERRADLIPVKNLMSLRELGQIRTRSSQKTTLNLTLVDEADFDIEVLKRYFDPEFFFIKLSPINKNTISIANGMGNGVISSTNLL